VPAQLIPAPTVAEISFLVASDINPDASGRPSPIIVRTYELKSLAAFSGADFFAVFDREKEVIGQDLVARDEWPLTPGNSRQAIKHLQKETRYVGVIAAYRDLPRAQWRAATLIIPNQTSRVEIRIDRSEVTARLH
jgi:type VI secretion system protein VasD